jgi:hypothetical protein
MERQMFARGGAVQRFQAGGPAMPMQDDPMAAVAMPATAMSDTAQLEQMPLEGVMGMAQQSGIDPAQLEQMLGSMAGQFQNMDEAEDYEQVMNAMRGDQAPIAARREELAGVVGPEDASATPESVLALVQPVMMMAAVDQGIGGLAAEEMNTPVEGPMAEGIMSMAMPQGAPAPMPQGAPPMPGMGAPAPVNFRFGGPVVAMQEGGEPGNRLAELFGQQRDVYRSLINPADQQAEMDRQRNMTQAQMLFDVANTALAFSAPGSRSGMSPAERLAEAAQQTQFFDRISQRTGAFEQSRQEQAKEGRALDLAALQSASGLQAAEFEASLRPVESKPVGDIYELRDAENNVLYSGPVSTRGEQDALLLQFPEAVTFQKVAARAAVNLQTFVNPQNPDKDFLVVDIANPENNLLIKELMAAVNPDGTPRYREGGPFTAPSGGGAAKLQVFVDRTDDNNVVYIDMSTEAGKEEAAALGPNFLPVQTPTLEDIMGGKEENPLGNSFNAKFLALISNPERMTAYGSGELDVTSPEEASMLTNALTLATQARPIWDQTLGREVMMPAMNLSQGVLDIIASREALGLSVPSLGANVGGPQTGAPVSNSPTDQTPGRVRFNVDGTIDLSSFENDPTFIITGVDLTKSQDWVSTVRRFFNIGAGQLQPILGGSGYAGEGGRITSVADTQLDRLANHIMRVARADTEGKIFVLDATLLGNEVDKFRPSGAGTDNGARDALVTTRNSLASMWNDAQIILMSPANYDQATIVSARTLQAQVERLLAETTAAVAIYDRFITGNPLSDAATDRSVTSPTTSNLPRVSGQ